MTVRITILHIYRLRKGSCDLTDQCPLFFFLLLYRLQLAPYDQTDDLGKQQHSYYHAKNVEPQHLIELLFLHDLNRQGLAAVPHRILKLHDEMIGSAPQVRIVQGTKLAAPYRRLRLIKSIQIICYLWIHKRIIIYIAVDRQSLDLRRNLIIAGSIRKDPFSIRIYIRHCHLQIIHFLKRALDIHLGNTRASGNVQITVLGYFTVGIRRRSAGQSIISSIEDRCDLIILDQLIGSCHVDSVTA